MSSLSTGDVFGVALAALLLSACQQHAPAAAAPAAVVALPVQADSEGSAADAVRYPIEAAARYPTVLSFRGAGKLIERRGRLGDPVHQGQVIAHLDPVDAEKGALSAQAVLDSAEHRLTFAK